MTIWALVWSSEIFVCQRKNTICVAVLLLRAGEVLRRHTDPHKNTPLVGTEIPGTLRGVPREQCFFFCLIRNQVSFMAGPENASPPWERPRENDAPVGVLSIYPDLQTNGKILQFQLELFFENFLNSNLKTFLNSNLKTYLKTFENLNIKHKWL